MRLPNLLDVRVIESPATGKSNWFCVVSGESAVFHLLRIQSPRLGQLALPQNSEALTHRNLHIQPANPCNETSRRGKRNQQRFDELLPALLRRGCPRNPPVACSCSCKRIVDRSPSK